MTFTIIEPDTDKAFNTPLMLRELELAVSKTLQVIDADFQKTVRTWERPAAFQIDGPDLIGGDLVGKVFTTSEIYGYVNFGTKPHDIYPKTAKVLRFQSSYKPKTRPNIIGSSGGGASGPDVFSQHVHHPGTEARNFDKEIAVRRQKTLETNVMAAVLRAAKGSR